MYVNGLQRTRDPSRMMHPPGQGEGRTCAGWFILRGWGYAHSLACPAACDRGLYLARPTAGGFGMGRQEVILTRT